MGAYSSTPAPCKGREKGKDVGKGKGGDGREKEGTRRQEEKIMEDHVRRKWGAWMGERKSTDGEMDDEEVSCLSSGSGETLDTEEKEDDMIGGELGWLRPLFLDKDEIRKLPEVRGS